MSIISDNFRFAKEQNTYFIIKYSQGRLDLTCECSSLKEVSEVLEDLHLEYDTTINGIDILTEHEIEMEDFEQFMQGEINDRKEEEALAKLEEERKRKEEAKKVVSDIKCMNPFQSMCKNRKDPSFCRHCIYNENVPINSLVTKYYKEDQEPKQYEVWIEGYRANEEHSTAQLLAKVEATNFKEACIKAVKQSTWAEPYFNEDNLTVWGCKMFDNEADARRNFG